MTHPHDSAAKPVTDKMVDLALSIYKAKVAEYDRDFRTDDKPEGFWERKYGTNLHATHLGEEWAMRTAIQAALLASPGIGAGTVKVRDLEWRKNYESEFLSFSETSVGRYRVWSHHEANGVWYWRRDDDAGGPASSEAEAKACAQMDFVRRVLAELVPSPAPWNGAAAEAVAYASRNNLQRHAENPGEMFLYGSKGTFHPNDEVPLYTAPVSLSSRVEAAEARVAVLEKALRRIAETEPSGHLDFHKPKHTGYQALEIARAALATPHQGGTT